MTAQAKSKERKLFESWLKEQVDGLGKKWQLHVLPSQDCMETRKSNGMSKASPVPKFSKHHATLYVGLLEHKIALKGSEIRKTFEEAQRKGITKQNKAILVLFKCVQWLCMANIPLVKFKLLLELLHDWQLDDIGYQSKTWS